MPERENPGLQADAELDRLLHSALATYGDLAPDSRLAERVLARVAAERGRESRLHWLPWAIAVPIAAGLLILILVFGSRPLRGPADHAGQARIVQPPAAAHRDERSSNSAPERPAEISRVKANRHRAEMSAQVAPLPKLAVFPTPQPLTPAERALAEYAAHAPRADRQSLIEMQKQMEEPLSIAAIQIQPLEPPEGGGN